MPSSFKWRDKKKGSKDQNKNSFKSWFEGKKKAKELRAAGKQKKAERGKFADADGAQKAGGKGKGGKGKAEGVQKASVKGKGRGSAGESKGKGRGRGFAGEGPSSGGSTGGFEPLASSERPPEGVSAGLLERLLATKRRLLGGADEGQGANQEAAAEAGEVKRQSGAGKGKSKGKGPEGLGDAGGKGKKRGASGAGQNEPAPKKARQAALWLAPASEVDREERVAMNRKIAEHGQARNLAGTRAVLADLETRGWANGHTYAAAVNALCRCGDWRAAWLALQRAEGASLLKRGAGAVSGVIARTAMLRGFCDSARDLGRARALLERMERMELVEARPNARTANTFLRGCLLLGAVGEAEALLSRMETEWSKDPEWSGRHGGAPDASSYEMVTLLLCQALRYADAVALAKRSLKRLGASPGSGAMFVAAARAAAVRGDADAAAAAAKKAQSLLAKDEEVAGIGASGDAGGKRGKERASDDGARARSLEVFQTHRRGELAAELREVETFLSGAATRGAIDLACLWARTVSFDDFVQVGGGGVGGPEDPTTAKGAAKAISRRLCERFGLEAKGPAAAQVLKAQEAAMRAEAPRSKNSGWKKKKRARAQASEAGEDASAVGAGTTAASSGPVMARLALGTLFPKIEGPVHLELCSGGGEWLCSQALLEPTVRWVGCELRFDRAARCFQRMVLQGLARADGNAGLIAGDGVEALSRRLLAGSVDRLFVNHPEPPHQTDLATALGKDGSNRDDENPASGAPEEGDRSGLAASHLLTEEFLGSGCADVLRPGGTLTICTDSHDYGLWLLQVLSRPPLSSLFEDALRGTKADKPGRNERRGGLALRSVAPPRAACGAEYSGEAGASYFQRLKLQEKSSRRQVDEEERYFLCLRRRAK